ncbi:phage tail tape measure protein [Clostridium sp. WILCCON 0269]|uniref:Phage tail tape measure protein n=1 Tax=Candidatus Clostridium eludens TaxID=3381663 RepID=A0ABW8SLS5_9CLOT
MAENEDVGSLAVKIAMEDSSFQQGLQNLKKNMAVIDSSFKESVAGLKDWGKNLDSLQGNASALGEKIEVQSQIVQKYQEQLEKSKSALENNSKAMMDLKSKVDEAKAAWQEAATAEGKNAETTKQLKQAYDDLNKQYIDAESKVRNNAKTLDGYTIQVNNAQAKLKELESQLESTNLKIDTQSSSWTQAGEKLNQMSEGFKNAGENLSSMGKGLTTYVSAPLAAAGVASVKFSNDFSDGLAKISTIADTTQMSIDSMGNGVIKLSNDTGKSVEDLNDGLYEAISSGVQTGDSLNFMSTAAETAVGGFADTETSVDGLTTVLNAYNLKSTDALKIANQMMVAQNLGKTTFGEMAKSIGLVADTTANMNIKTQDLFSSLAVETAHGIDTSEAISGLREALSNIIKPTDDAAKMAQQLGLQFNASHLQSVGWAQFLQEIQEKAHGNTTEMGALFGSVQGLNTMITLTSESGMQLFNQSLQQMNSNTNYVDDAFNKVNNTSGQNFKKSLNELKNSSIELGQALTPALNTLSGLFKGLAEGLNNLSPGQRQFVVDAGLMVVATGPLLSGIGKISTGIGALESLLGKFSVAAGTATTTAEASTAAAGAAATAVEGATVAEVGAGAAAATAAGAGGLGALATGLGALVIAAAPWIAAAAGIGLAGYGIYHAMSEQAVPAVDLFNSKVQSHVQTINNYGTKIDSTITKTVNFSESTKKAVSSYMQMDDTVKKTMTDIYVNSDKFTNQTKTAIVSQFTDMANKVTSLNGNAKNKVLTDFTNMVSNTNTLTTKNKTDIIAQYTQMVNKVSELTEQQKQDTIKKFTDTLIQSTGITKNQVDSVISQFTAMGTKIKQGEDTQYNARYKAMQDYFSKSDVLSTQEEQKILANMTSNNTAQKAKIDDYLQQITTIETTALNNHRQLSTQEQQEINSIQDKMRTNAVQSLSDNEIQSKVILERMKSYGTSITEQQAQSIIQSANKQRDGAIAAANDQYNKTVANFIYQRDVTHSITADQATKLIADAGQQRDQSIQAAKDQRTAVVDHLSKMDSEVIKNMDTDTGNMLSPWHKLTVNIEKEWTALKTWFSNTPIVATIKAALKNDVGTASIGSGNGLGGIPGLATGTDYAPAGWHWVGEEGPELMNFAGGEQVITAKNSKDIVEQMQNGGQPKTTNTTASTSQQMKSTEQYAENLNSSLGTGISNSISAVTTPLNDLISKLNTLMTNFSTQYMEYRQQNVKNLGSGIAQGQDTATTPLNTLITSLNNNMDTFASNALNYGTKTTTSMGNGISNGSDAVTSAGNAVTTALDNNFNAFAANAVNYGSNAAANIGSGITGSSDAVVNAGSGVTDTLDNNLNDFASNALNYGLNTDTNIGNGITSNSDAVIGAQSAVTNTLSKNLSAFTTNSINYGLNTDTNIGSGINNNANAVISAQNNVTTTLGNNLNAFATAATQYGQGTDTSIANGITSTSGSVTGAGNAVTATLGSNFNTFAQGCTQYGTGVTNSIADGMRSTEDNAVSIAHELTQKILDAFTGSEGFDIHSPSRKTTEYGENVIQGFINGMSSQDAVAIFKNKIGSMLSAAGAMSGNVSEWIMEGIMAEGAPMSWFLPLEMIASRESGSPGTLGTGDPSLVNNVGVNGEYATGLMQVLPSTFEGYFGSDDGIFNPVMSVRAAIKEIEESWGGNPYNIPGLMDGNGYLGYETGTDNADAGAHPVAENGFEIIMNKTMGLFKGGETVLNNSDSMKLLSSISQLGSNATAWGSDIVQNIASGMNSKLSTIKDAATNVANGVYRILHFSVPDEGPLADADTYGSDFMQLLADTMDQNSDKPTEAAEKVANLVSEKIKSIKDSLASDTKDLNNQLEELSSQETVAIRGVKGADKYAIQDEYNAKKKAIKDEIDLRKDQANKEIDEIQKIGKMSKEQIQDELDAKKQAASDIDKLNDVLEKAIERQLNAEKDAATESAKTKAKETNLTKDQLDSLLSYIDQYYEKKLDKDAIAAQAEQLITSKNQDAIIALLNKYGNLYEDSGLTLGQRLTTGVKTWTDLVPTIVGNAMQNVQTEVQTAAVNVQNTLSGIMQNISSVGTAEAQLAGGGTNNFDAIFTQWQNSSIGSTQDEDPVQTIEDKYKSAFDNIDLAMTKLDKDTYSTTEELQKQQDTIDEQTKKLSLMQKEYNEVVAAVGETSDGAVQLQKDMASLSVEIENDTKKLQQDTITNKYENAINNIDDAISKLDVDTTSLSDEMDKQNNIYSENMQKLTLMKEEYDELADIFGKNSDAALNLEKDISDLSSTITSDVTKATQDISGGIDDFTNKVKDALKEMYTEEEQAAEDSISSQLDDLDKWKDASEQNINDVYDAKINALEAQTEAEDRAATDASELANISSLQESIDYEHNEYNKEQLQKQLNTAVDDRNKRLHEQDIADQKAALEQEKQNQLDNLSQLYDAKKQDLQNQLQDVKDFYAKKLDATNLEADAEKTVMESNQNEIVKLLESYSSDYENAGKTLGEKLFEGFKSKIEGITDMISSITEQLNTAKDAAVQAAEDSIVSNSASVTSPTYASGQTIVNNIIYNSPTVLSPSEQNRQVNNMLTKAAFSIG